MNLTGNLEPRSKLRAVLMVLETEKKLKEKREDQSEEKKKGNLLLYFRLLKHFPMFELDIYLEMN